MAEKTRKQILIEKRDAINKQIKDEEDKEKKAKLKKETQERDAKRKKENKQKFLTGAAVLDEARGKTEYKADLLQLLNRFLTKDYDRSFFADWGLPPQHKSKIKPTLPETENEPTSHKRENEPA